MSRISDTRRRTREAAARLVAAGKRPHELTVDLIYAEIRQGSRTTINDELKQWKDEQAKADALSAQLPSAVADAMLAAWAVAVEHGEKAFEARSDELETELATVVARAEAAERALAAGEETGRLREARCDAQAAQIADLQRQLAASRETAEAARAHQAALAQQIDDAQAQLDALRAVHAQELATLRAAAETRAATFQSELEKATQRLEGVQKHMMQQISEAREEQKRTVALNRPGFRGGCLV